MTETSAHQGPKRISRRARIALTVVAGGVAAVAILALASFKGTPEVYRRTADMGPDPAAVARFNEHVINQVGNVLLDKSGRTPLDLVVTEEMANARIARFLADQAASGKPVSPILRRLRVGFEPTGLVLATEVGSGMTSAIVSQHLRLSADTEGRFCVEPAGTDVGWMPVPKGALDYVRQAVAAALARREARGADETTLQLWRSILDGLDGKPIPLGKGKRRIVLESIELERGVLRMKGYRSKAKSK
jgi:hypothetical protein